MKRNLRVGVLARLLLVPGAIVHANEGATNPLSEQPIPYNTVASLTDTERLINLFVESNENYTSGEVELQRARFAGLNEAERALLTEPTVNLINAKITYLEQYVKFKSQATSLTTLIKSLSLTSSTLITNTEKAEADRSALLTNILAAEDTLESVAAVEGSNGTTLLANLDYYGGNGPTDFITANVGAANLSILENRIAEIVEPKEFISTYIEPIITAAAVEPFSKEEFESEVKEARQKFDPLETTVKNITKTQVVSNGKKVEDVIKGAEADLLKAIAVEAKVNEIHSTTFTSATTFKSKMSAVQSSFNGLTDFQKILVTNYDSLEDYEAVIAVIEAIDAIKIGEENYREQVTTVQTQYNALNEGVPMGSVLQSYVTNYSKLTDMIAAIPKAVAIEVAINNITAANASVEVPATRTAYETLTTSENKHVDKGIYEILTTWEKSSTTAAAVVKQINAIVVKKSDFVSKTKTATAGYAKITAATGEPETREQQLVTNRKRLLALQPFAEIVNNINSLKVMNAAYEVDLAKAKVDLTAWTTLAVDDLTENDIKELAALKGELEKKVEDAVTEQGKASELVTLIASLQTTVDLVKMVEIRQDYTKLTSNGKKLVTNIKVLTDLEKQYKAALNVVTLIEKLDFKAKDFAKKVLAADTAYNKITPTTLKSAVSNYSILEGYKPVAQLMIDIDALKPTAKDFREKVEAARTSYTTVIGSTAAVEEPETAQERVVNEYLSKLETAELVLVNAETMIASINGLKNLSGQQFMDALNNVSTGYKAMPAATKKNVTNAKDLTDLERDYKASLKVYNLIEKLPPTTDKTFAKKVEAAEKAYQKLTTTQKGYVFNYTTKLATVLNVANLIGRIDALKISSKTYEIDVNAIRAEYDVLSDTDKVLVYNYKNLEAAESNMSTAQTVMTLIDAAIPNAEEYIAKLTAARAAYDGLDKTQQKLVLNYKELTAREKSVKPVLTLDKQITALNTSNVKTFLSKYKSALKSYEKLTYAERGLLLNENQLTTVLQPLYNVIDQINSIKSSSKTFVSDTQSARAAYNALTAEQQAQIGNYRTLQDHELNVAGGANVDALIRALSSSDPKEYVQKVKEARTAYNALSSANKKAVTLVDTLKDEEKYVKPVETVIDLIEGLSNPRNDLSKQFDKVNAALKKLDAEQISFISNYDKYSDLSDVIFVYQLIAKLKPSDKYYLGNLQAAKLAYGKLSMEDKLRVTNYYKLQEAEQDVTEIERVTNVIGSLSSSSSTYFADIEAALAAYKTIPSASRKQVLNYTNLQAAEKNMKAAQKVMKSIEELDSSLRNFESKTKAVKKAYEKLTDDQKKIVANYNLLQSYLFDLGL